MALFQRLLTPRLPPPPDPAQAARYWALLFGFVASLEGVQLVAKHDYIDPAGTIVYCIGATYPYEPRPVKIGQRFTREECSAIFREDIKKYEDPLRKCIKKFDDLPSHRKVAISSSAYNLGPERVCKELAPKLNRGDLDGACRSLLKYNKSIGELRPGLVKRRALEQQWCLRSD